MKLTKLRPDVDPGQFDFFVLHKGHNAGKPRHQPWVNSFGVKTEHPARDYARFMVAFESGLFDPYRIGTCVLTMRKGDLMRIASSLDHIDHQHGEALVKLAQVIELTTSKLTSLKDMKRAYAQKFAQEKPYG